MDTAAIEQALCEFFADSPAAQGMAAAYLFGSVARGEAHAGSDVALAVLTASGPRPGLAGLELGLEEQLERLLGRPVQLIVLDEAPVDLVHRVLRRVLPGCRRASASSDRASADDGLGCRGRTARA